ncbi:sugar ABC transporter permease [bacterium]|nr:sugar ABC transporter permease [bacterium]
MVSMQKSFHETRAAYAFIAPALSAISLFFLLPVLAGLLLSFTDFDIYAIGDIGNARFVGFRNYILLFQNARFWKALGNTFYFVIVGGTLSIAMSLFAAVLVSSRLTRFRSFFRTIYFAPVITTLVAVSVVWRYLYHARFGLLNYFLSFAGIDPIDWLGNLFWAMPAIIILAVWKNFGYNMIIFMAALQNIPEQLYESARIDGAGTWHQFWHITVPMLRPSSLFVGMTTMIGYFQLFAEPYVMTRGGPLDATLSIVLLMYQEGFRWWNLGYAAAIAFVLFVIILISAVFRLWLQRGKLA